MIEGSSKTNVEVINTELNETKSKEITVKPKEIHRVELKEKEQLKQEEQKIEITSNDEFEKCLTLVELKDITRGEKIGKQAVFCNMKDELIELLIHPDILEEVCKWEVASVIIPVNIYEQNNYKILKEFKDVEIIKKAV